MAQIYVIDTVDMYILYSIYHCVDYKNIMASLDMPKQTFSSRVINLKNRGLLAGESYVLTLHPEVESAIKKSTVEMNMQLSFIQEQIT